MRQLDDNIEFQLRSDFIETEDLLNWNVDNDHFAEIQVHLRSTGTKLLIGPRGSGKTHQMRICQEKCRSNPEFPLCIYISFTKYLYLEPYLSKSGNAVQIFHSWILAKIVLACFEIDNNTIHFNKCLTENGFTFDLSQLIEFIAIAERRMNGVEDSEIFGQLNLITVSNLIEIFRVSASRRRTVLLFDDAALTFTQEYMVELFDIIRSIKSKTISPKASVYPGTTEYGPRFHLGHDGDEVICWMVVNDPNYSKFMSSLISKRFSKVTESIPEKILEIFKYASFGIPRAFISLILNYLKSRGRNQQANFNHALEKQEEFIRSEYMSLIKKMPQFTNVIQVGYEYFMRCVELLSQVNRGLSGSKQMIIGLDMLSISNLRLFPRMKQFLYEAGLIYDLGIVRHGPQRIYDRFIIHSLFLLRSRAFSGASRGFNPTKILEKLQSADEKHPLRKQISQIINESVLGDLKLDFPACTNCKTVRIAVDQMFCHNCGAELVKQSVFNECLKVPVEELAITNWQKEQMKQNGYNIIEDFVSKKDPASSLREIYRIGKVKAEKITNTVESFINEFLS